MAARDEVTTSTNRHDAQSPTRSGGGAFMDRPIAAQITATPA